LRISGAGGAHVPERQVLAAAGRAERRGAVPAAEEAREREPGAVPEPDGGGLY